MGKSIEVLKAMVLKAFKNYRYVYQTGNSVTVEYRYTENPDATGHDSQRNGYGFVEDSDNDSMRQIRTILAYCDRFVIDLKNVGQESIMLLVFGVDNSFHLNGVELIISENHDDKLLIPEDNLPDSKVAKSRLDLLTEEEKEMVLKGDFSGVVRLLDNVLSLPKTINLSSLAKFSEVEKMVKTMFSKTCYSIESFELGLICVHYRLKGQKTRQLKFSGAELDAFRDLVALSDCFDFSADQYNNGDGGFELAFGYDIDK